MTTPNARQRASAARLVAAGFALPAAARLLGVTEEKLQELLDTLPAPLIRTGWATASSPLLAGERPARRAGRVGRKLSGQAPCDTGGALSGHADAPSPGPRFARADLPAPGGGWGGAGTAVIQNRGDRQDAGPSTPTPSTEDM